MSGWRRRAVLLGCWAAAAAQAQADEAPAARYSQGAAVFQTNCALCHGPAGGGQAGLAPPLTHYPARYIGVADGRRQLIMTVLYGMYDDITVDQKHYNFKMPDFARLDDETLAAVLNFVAFDLAHAPQEVQPLSAPEIAGERLQPVSADAVRHHRAALIDALGL